MSHLKSKSRFNVIPVKTGIQATSRRKSGTSFSLDPGFCPRIKSGADLLTVINGLLFYEPHRGANMINALDKQYNDRFWISGTQII